MPNPWPLVPLGEMLTPVSRPEPVRPDETYRILGAHWYAQGLYVKETTTGASVRAGTLYRVAAGDFVYNRLFAWKGSFAVATSENADCYVSNEFPCFRPNPDRLDARFLWRYFSRSSTWDKALNLSTGGTPTSRNRLKEDKFLAFTIPLPPFDEQRRIVARIEALAAKIEEARGVQRQAAEEAEALLPSSSLTIFSTTENRIPLGSTCDVIDPNPSHRYPAYVDKGVPIVSSSEFIGEDGIDPRLAKRVPLPFYETTLGRFGVGEGDIIFSRKGKVGYARLHPGDVKLAMTHTLCVLKPEHGTVDSRYLLHFARSPMFLEELTGTMNPNAGVPTLGLGVIRDASIPVPPLREQRRIAAELDALQAKVDALKRLQAETAAELDALLPSILDRAFKGEL